MTTPGEKKLDAQLAEMTHWTGGGTQLWRNALRVANSNARQTSWLQQLLIRPISIWVLGGLSMGCVFVVAVITNTSHLSHPRSTASKKLASRDSSWAYQGQAPATPSQFVSPSTEVVNANLRGIGQAMYINAADDQHQFPLDQGVTDSSSRQIIRKATIELKSSDVRSVFLKAEHLVRLADGEFVQDSTLAGTGREAGANLTLRVRADRLSDVLNELRGMAEVTSENQEGQDVTSQMIDLEAQLRNEKRVETEVLDLLEKRKDAPLKDILELRNALKDIRLNIERLTGQKAQLAKLVSLATVLVIIRTGDVAEPAGVTSFGGYFSTVLGIAWRDGVFFLFDTAATMVRIIVGGMLFWLLLVIVFAAVRRYRKRTIK